MTDFSLTTFSSYTANAEAVLREYASFIEGSPNALIVALSALSLSDDGRFALERSAEKMGYGTDRIAYISCLNAEGRELLADELWRLIEGIDPLCLFIADEAAALRCASAYGLLVCRPGITQIFGRRWGVVFALDENLATDEGKQQLWQLLKRLLRF